MCRGHRMRVENGENTRRKGTHAGGIINVDGTDCVTGKFNTSIGASGEEQGEPWCRRDARKNTCESISMKIGAKSGRNSFQVPTNLNLSAESKSRNQAAG